MRRCIDGTGTAHLFAKLLLRLKRPGQRAAGHKLDKRLTLVRWRFSRPIIHKTLPKNFVLLHHGGLGCLYLLVKNFGGLGL